MRLLSLDADGELILSDFRGRSIPPYATLSHRWTSSEILMEDIVGRTYKSKKEGYEKLEFCSKQAARHDLQYFWIDTCCVDRWDTRERSRAINSMFRWCKNAARCYVFLSDVLISAAPMPVDAGEWDTSFRQSQWFTRGWTLQELIAPSSVEFFSCDGRRIGDKNSLEGLLHLITGIPVEALRTCPLDQFSTAERMHWAENRQTTEEEDIVYCLLGILGVSMPTTYGEGKDTAYVRLRAELDGTSSAASMIPFARNTDFVGREQQLDELEAKLLGDERIDTPLIIVGPGGTGKSQLALEVAHRIRLAARPCSVLWLDASEEDKLHQSYLNVAENWGYLGGTMKG